MNTISPEQLINSLQWRYAVKEFDASKKIPQTEVDALIDSLVLTPSSFGLQPWKFVVVADQGVKDKMPAISWNQPQPRDCSHMVVLTVKSEFSGEDVDRFIKCMAEARGVTVESLEGYRGFAGGFVEQANKEGWIDEWTKCQAYIAIGQLMAAAALMGVDACPMEGILAKDYDELLGLPEMGYRSVLGCALGYRSESDKYANMPKARYGRDEVVTVV